MENKGEGIYGRGRKEWPISNGEVIVGKAKVRLRQVRPS